jgi:hypothetical protein
VIRMIEIGETALNTQFDRRADIARAASGSLNIAQPLCFHLAAAAGVLGTQAKRTVIRSEVRSAVATVIEQISLKFGETIRTFAALGDRRDTTASRSFSSWRALRKGSCRCRAFATRAPSAPAASRGF